VVIKLHSWRKSAAEVKGDSMKTRRLILLSVGLLILAASSARAHFLFIHIGPPAEGGRVVEVYFSEQAEAGDPRFVEKIAHTRLWMQTAAGQLQELKAHKGADRLRAYLPAAGSVVVVGSCEYGVLARPEQTPFLLRYYPKAIAGKPAELCQAGHRQEEIRSRRPVLRPSRRRQRGVEPGRIHAAWPQVASPSLQAIT
jgi:hypothetical protein